MNLRYSCGLFIVFVFLLISLGCGAGTSAKAPGVSSGSSSGPTPSSSSISVSVSPASATVEVGATQQFVASVTGTSNSAVTWMVNQVAGGSASAGTISSGGLYTAPAAVPNPATIQVTAVSQADGSKSATVALTVAPVKIGHVFLLVEENHGYSSVIGNSAMPYLNGLANQYGLATNYYANAHPSIGNYFMLTTGQLVTTDDAFTGTVNVDNLVRELIAAGKTWKSYAESLPAVGYTGGDQYPYLVRHHPFAYFSDVRNSSVQRQNLVPFTQFSADLANGQLADFSYIVPNAEHDGHDCPDGTQNCADSLKLSTADSWLNRNIAPLLSTAAFQHDGLLVIVFDEAATSDSSHGGGHVAMLVISPKAKAGYKSSTFYQHQSTLKLLVGLSGAAAAPGSSASAPEMREFLP